MSRAVRDLVELGVVDVGLSDRPRAAAVPAAAASLTARRRPRAPVGRPADVETAVPEIPDPPSDQPQRAGWLSGERTGEMPTPVTDPGPLPARNGDSRRHRRAGRRRRLTPPGASGAAPAKGGLASRLGRNRGANAASRSSDRPPEGRPRSPSATGSPGDARGADRPQQRVRPGRERPRRSRASHPARPARPSGAATRPDRRRPPARRRPCPTVAPGATPRPAVPVQAAPIPARRRRPRSLAVRRRPARPAADRPRHRADPSRLAVVAASRPPLGGRRHRQRSAQRRPPASPFSGLSSLGPGPTRPVPAVGDGEIAPHVAAMSPKARAAVQATVGNAGGSTGAGASQGEDIAQRGRLISFLSTVR